MSRKHATADSRRSTAAQFFMDEEGMEATTAKTANSKSLAKPKQTHDKVVDLINQAVTLPKDSKKVYNLKQVQELIIHKEPNLLDNFLDEMLAFQHDKSSDVRKFIVGFIEEACKKDPETLPKVVANLNMMLADEAVAVQKRVIQAATQLFKVALQWLCKAKTIDDVMESTWAYMSKLKTQIIRLLESENDGIRTHAIKFIEMLVIVQTYPDADSPKKGENDIALDEVPLILKVIRPHKLEEEAKQMFETLVVFHGTAHISSVNLMACMQTLTLIAKHRSQFMSKVIQALEALHANLPPTLAKSQVSSVRKHLKLQLLILLKHPAAVDFHTQITTLLTDLGATQQEIMKSMPKPENLKKRTRITEDSATSKRIKLEAELEDEKEEEEEQLESAQISKAATNTAIDITADDIMPRLTSLNVTDLVLVSMLSLPETMPAQFQSSYTPIAVAGTSSQIQHLARLIATQLTAAGLGKGVEEMSRVQEEETAMEEEVNTSTSQTIETVVGGTVGREIKRKLPVLLLPTGSQVFLNYYFYINLFLGSAALGGISQIRIKILACLATQFRAEISEMLRNFIFEDFRNRADVAFAWLYEEYATYQGFNQMSQLTNKPSIEYYENCFCLLLEGLLSKGDQKERDMYENLKFLNIFVKIVIRIVLIIYSDISKSKSTRRMKQLNLNEITKPLTKEDSDNLVISAVERILKAERSAALGGISQATVSQGLATLKALVERRPPRQQHFLETILQLSLNEKMEVRNQAVHVTKELHERGQLRTHIEEFALKSLKYLLNNSPPAVLVSDRSRPLSGTWTEEYTKVCLHLYLTLLPINHKLIHDLASVYVGTVASIKRTILRALENPVKGMGMASPELLLLVENCPKGAETLVTRIIHILTDKAPPSAELVARVRDLYHKRVPDVRFLIPVLNGLTKKEVIAVLPKLIKLNPIVVKEVFNRLLGSHTESGTSYTSPLRPDELLIALHNIDPSKCDMKTIIKATSLCFAEKHVYTQEVLAVVMKQLMEQNPLPTLLMRTVIQSLSHYPRLIGFVMNILQRLILKQVWKQKKVWEGFIKCCQRTKPQSFQVLLQLPPAQLTNVFEVSPDLREPLQQHISSFTEHQRAHIPQAVLDLVIGDSNVEKENQLLEDISQEELPAHIKNEECLESLSQGQEQAVPFEEGIE
ncbi:symplekin-like [Centruroides sculpturatus]|uniref:symplekin-like n=1 Tax=Centruroides sculpturatus TaxID=218467 RepID=UPI000C6E9C96|nr:symplekin-like [Centruroides sculpturatus]